MLNAEGESGVKRYLVCVPGLPPLDKRGLLVYPTKEMLGTFPSHCKLNRSCNSSVWLHYSGICNYEGLLGKSTRSIWTRKVFACW